MTPGILPSTPPGPRRFRAAYKIAPGDLVEPQRRFSSTSTAPFVEPDNSIVSGTQAGGGRWIRTTEGVSQQIYSLPPLAAWVSLQQRTGIVPSTSRTVNKSSLRRPYRPPCSVLERSGQSSDSRGPRMACRTSCAPGRACSGVAESGYAAMLSMPTPRRGRNLMITPPRPLAPEPPDRDGRKKPASKCDRVPNRDIRATVTTRDSRVGAACAAASGSSKSLDKTSAMQQLRRHN